MSEGGPTMVCAHAPRRRRYMKRRSRISGHSCVSWRGTRPQPQRSAIIEAGCQSSRTQPRMLHEHVSPTEHEGTAPHARMSGSVETIRMTLPQSTPVHLVSALSERTFDVPSNSCLAMQRAFSSGACSAIHVTPSQEDTCHWPCMSSTATSVSPAPENDMTAGTQRSGVCACAQIGISNATTAAARFKLPHAV